MKKILLLFSTIILVLSSCEKIINMNNKYEWLTLTVADQGYIMEIVEGTFYNQKGELISSIPNRQVLQSQWWDGDSGVMIIGEEYKEIPSRMTIKWFSYAEDKFYEGDFQLDYEKISNLFNEGSSCEKGNYKYLKVAIAPGGQIYLYLTGPNSTIVGSYQAKENFNLQWVDLGNRNNEQRMNAILNYQKKMPVQTQQEISEKRINTQIWKDINIHYLWNYTQEVIDDERLLIIQKDKLGTDYINGEGAWCKTPDYFTKVSPKAIPLEIDAKFKTQAGMELVTRIYPGNVNGVEAKKQSYEVRRAREQELVKLFKNFYEKIGKQEFSIHLKISDDYKTGKVYLKKDKIEEEIPNVEVQIFNTTFDD